MVKKIFSIISAIIVFSTFFTSCGNNYRKEEEKIAMTFISCFLDNDKEKLLNMFSNEMLKYKGNTIKEIDKAFDFLDGTIISYDYDNDTASEKKFNNGKCVYYQSTPIFYNIKTNNNKSFTIWFTYYMICNNNPNLIGVSKIKIIDEKDSDSYCIIGKNL